MTPLSAPPAAADDLRYILAQARRAGRQMRGSLTVTSPITGTVIARVANDGPARWPTQRASARSTAGASGAPYPRRAAANSSAGSGDELREQKADLGRARHARGRQDRTEGLGEVQEMIDICDFAVGLSRQLYGLTIATERPDHAMTETWLPLGRGRRRSRRSTSRSRSGPGTRRSRWSAATR